METNIGNPGDNKKNKKARRAERIQRRVLKVYKDQEQKNEQRFQADLKKAKAHDQNVKSGGSKWKSRGKPSEEHLRQSWLIGNKASKISESANVAVRKESGAYKSSPQVSGGNKKLLRISKRNIRKNAASKQAKASAKKLY